MGEPAMTLRLKTLFAAALALMAFTIAPAIAGSKVQLVMFEQELCEWCEVWDEQIGVVYHKTTEGKRAPLRRVDIHDDMPEDLLEIAPVIYTPTFVLLHDGVEIGRIKGYPGEDFFWGMLAAS